MQLYLNYKIWIIVYFYDTKDLKRFTMGLKRASRPIFIIICLLDYIYSTHMELDVNYCPKFTLDYSRQIRWLADFFRIAVRVQIFPWNLLSSNFSGPAVILFIFQWLKTTPLEDIPKPLRSKDPWLGNTVLQLYNHQDCQTIAFQLLGLVFAKFETMGLNFEF